VIAAALVALAGLGVAAYLVLHEDRPDRKRGSETVEFNRDAGPERQPPRPTRRVNELPWPTYAFDLQRTHLAAGLSHRPPYRRVWRLDAGDTLEFPPSIGYGRAYLAQQKGRFFAIDSRTGRIDWQRDFKRCAAASPTIGPGRVVYQSYMDYVNCPQARPGASGFLIAMDARSGRRKWIFRAAPIESSPLLVRGTLYVGSWDHKVYAINARNGRVRWSFEADDEVNTSAAYSRGRVFIASDGGTVYALDARTGRKLWSNVATGGREFFYATPTVAYGRVFIGNTNGAMYAYGARSGRLLWVKPAGTYIYAAAAVRNGRLFFGTYDGSIYALDAGTGDTVWKRSAEGAIHAAPTILGGLVYFATCSSCGSAASRAVKQGPDSTFAVSPRTGRTVWRTGSGKFANPIVADERRVYLTGRSFLYGLAPRGSRRERRTRRR
jgi:outer membrane protein assembly factor BamB